MVKKTLSAITHKIGGLHTAAFWLAGFSLASQILAFLRDRLLAYYFGASKSLDLYYASFEVPDLIFTTAASLISASILVPLLTRWDNENNEKKERYINSIFVVFTLLLIVTCAIAWYFMPWLIQKFFSSFGESEVEEVIKLSRIMLLSPLFLGLSNFFGSITQYEKRFLLYSISPLLYNLGIIFGTIIGASQFGISAVIVGVVSGAFFHMFLQLVWVFSSGNGPKFSKKIEWKETVKTFSLSIPRTISLSASSLVGLIFVAIASKFPAGSIAAYTFSFNLQSVPLVIIGASYSLAAFPTLASHFLKKEVGALSECLSSGLRHIVFWSLPITALFIVLRAHIVRVVLGSGKFDWSDTRITAAALAIFVSSILFQSLQLFLTRAHYAFGKTRLPLLINLLSAGFTVVIAFLFTDLSPQSKLFLTLGEFLKVEGLERLVVLGLPLSFSIGAFISAVLLWWFIESSVRKSIGASLFTSFLSSLCSALIAGLVSWIALQFFDRFFNLDVAIQVFLHGAIAGAVGIGAVYLFLLKTGNREFLELKQKLL